MNPQRIYSRKLNNVLHAFLLLGGMTALLMLVGWVTAGLTGTVLGVLFGIMLVAFSPRVSPALVLKLYGARNVGAGELPGLFALLRELALRAELGGMPQVYYIPSRMMNAFSVGSRKNTAIAVTDGLLRGLSTRELASVLAHEVSHIRHNDMWIMSLADSVSRLVRLLAFAGIVLLLVNLPVMLVDGRAIPWLLVAALMFAPTLSALLQLALSRNREFDADLEAVQLTGDPAGLAAALENLEYHQGRLWERIFLRGARIPQPSLLRTHPRTEERVRRLRELTELPPQPIGVAYDEPMLPSHWPAAASPPSYRWHGIRY